MGGILVILWLIGYAIVYCLTINAKEDHLVQAMYPTKEILKQRLKVYLSECSAEE